MKRVFSCPAGMYALCVGRGKDGCLTPSQRDNLLSSRRGLSASDSTHTAQHLSRENQAFAAGMPHDRIAIHFLDRIHFPSLLHA